MKKGITTQCDINIFFISFKIFYTGGLMLVEGFGIWGLSQKKSVIQASLFVSEKDNVLKLTCCISVLMLVFAKHLVLWFIPNKVSFKYAKFIDTLRTHRMF